VTSQNGYVTLREAKAKEKAEEEQNKLHRSEISVAIG